MPESQHSPFPAPQPDGRQAPKTSQDPPRTLSASMKVNIGLLVLLTIISIFVLMFGEFEGKLVRTFSTLVLFAAFTGFAAVDAAAERPLRHVVVSQIGHMYMLGLSLVLIWGSLAVPRPLGGAADPWSGGELIFYMVLIVGIVKGAIQLIRKVSDWAVSPHQQLAIGAKAALALIAVLAVLFTLPLGTSYAISFPEVYWRTTVALVLLTGLALSVSILLIWSLRERKEPTRGVDDEPRRQPTAPVTAAPGHSPAPVPSFAPPAAAVRPQRPVEAPQERYAPPVPGVRAWPVFPDGQPLPAAANGRPDFAALQYVASIYVESERQWGGR